MPVVGGSRDSPIRPGLPRPEAGPDPAKISLLEMRVQALFREVRKLHAKIREIEKSKA